MRINAAAIQMSATKESHEVNVNRAENLILQAASKKVKLCVLPELILDEFFAQWKDTKYFSYAEEVTGETVKKFQKIARETSMHIALPFYEKGVMGNCYNSVALISDLGEVAGVYRKNHIPFTRTYEKYYFTPGNCFPVFDTALGKIGIVICYDRRFPESCRELVKKGAEIILIPISSMRFKGVEFSEIPIWEPELRVRAVENQAYVIAANRSGCEDNYEFIGRSMIVSPTGEVLSKACEEENVLVISEIDTALVDETRKSLPLFRDRRSDLY